MDKLILDQSKLRELVTKLKDEGKQVVFTNGRFELLHVGHVRCLTQAKKLGDVLVVGLNSDQSVRSLKHREPFASQMERAEVLSALACVDFITIFDEPTVDNLLLKLKPDIHAKGTDYTIANVPERDTVLSYGGKIAIVGDPKEHSSTNLFERLDKLAKSD